MSEVKVNSSMILEDLWNRYKEREKTEAESEVVDIASAVSEVKRRYTFEEEEEIERLKKLIEVKLDIKVDVEIEKYNNDKYFYVVLPNRKRVRAIRKFEFQKECVTKDGDFNDCEYYKTDIEKLKVMLTGIRSVL